MGQRTSVYASFLICGERNKLVILRRITIKEISKKKDKI